MPNGPKIKTYVISLKGSDKRRASIKEQFEKFGIEYEIIDAVRGSELDMENDSRIDMEAVKKASHWLTPGAIGCALSHMECYRKAKEDDLDYVVVIEDDARIVKDYTLFQEKICQNLKDGEVAMLYYTAFTPIVLDARSKVPLDEETALYQVKSGLPITTTAYILSRKAYTKLLEGLLPIRVTSDAWDYFIKQEMLSSIVCIYPNPIDTMDFKSDIMYLGSGWIQKLTSIVDKYTLFPFYQILKGMRRRTKLKMKQTKIV